MTDSGSPRDEGEADAAALTGEAKGARLTRLKINRFRQVAPGTELRFDDGINVLLGRNGTGKTTLLELICAVVRGDLRDYRHDTFDLEFELQFNNLAFVVSAQNTGLIARLIADPIAREEPHSWNLRMDFFGPNEERATIEATPRTARMTLAHGSSEEISTDDASLFHRMFHVFPFWQHWPDGRPLTTPAMAFAFSIGTCCLRLDEGLDVFRCMVDGQTLPSLGLPLSVTSEFGATSVQFSRWYAPLGLAARIHDLGPSLHEATAIDVAQSDFEALDAFAKAIRARSTSCAMALLEREENAEKGTTVSSFGKPSFWITNQRGTTYTHDQLSYGEKRLLTFLYHAAANPEILVADELVNGLHHEWIQTCLDAIQGQAFLTSQNPLLLDHLPFSSAEEVQHRFVLCDRDDQGNWIWRNMTPDEADSFYRAYEVGIQHVSEILETKGLW